jgi:hypothetical protein
VVHSGRPSRRLRTSFVIRSSQDGNRTRKVVAGAVSVLLPGISLGARYRLVTRRVRRTSFQDRHEGFETWCRRSREAGRAAVLKGRPAGASGGPPLRVAPVIVAALAAFAAFLVLHAPRSDRDGTSRPQTVVSPSADRSAANEPGTTALTTAASPPAQTTIPPAQTTIPPAQTTIPPGQTTTTEAWVRLTDTMRTRCAPHGGVRLFLGDGETEPVGLLDDSCPA